MVMIPARPWVCMKHINLDSLSPTFQITKKLTMRLLHLELMKSGGSHGLSGISPVVR